MARYNDGLNELSHEDLHALGIDNRIPNVNSLSRQQLIDELRRRGIQSPFIRSGPSTDDDEPSVIELDENEYADLQETVEAYREDHPDAPVKAWRVTLSTGTKMLIYATDEGADDIALDHDIVPVDDDMMMSVDVNTPIYNDLQGASTQPRRRPRLPERRIGKHTTGEPVADIGTQRRLLPRSSTPPPEGGTVSHFPRHRKR